VFTCLGRRARIVSEEEKDEATFETIVEVGVDSVDEAVKCVGEAVESIAEYVAGAVAGDLNYLFEQEQSVDRYVHVIRVRSSVTGLEILRIDLEYNEVGGESKYDITVKVVADEMINSIRPRNVCIDVDLPKGASFYAFINGSNPLAKASLRLGVAFRCDDEHSGEARFSLEGTKHVVQVDFLEFTGMQESFVEELTQVLRTFSNILGTLIGGGANSVARCVARSLAELLSSTRFAKHVLPSLARLVSEVRLGTLVIIEKMDAREMMAASCDYRRYLSQYVPYMDLVAWEHTKLVVPLLAMLRAERIAEPIIAKTVIYFANTVETEASTVVELGGNRRVGLTNRLGMFEYSITLEVDGETLINVSRSDRFIKEYVNDREAGSWMFMGALAFLNAITMADELRGRGRVYLNEYRVEINEKLVETPIAQLFRKVRDMYTAFEAPFLLSIIAE